MVRTDRDGDEQAVRSYYAALDGGDYAALREILAADFVQRRPDRSFEGREAFVAFVREERPLTDTSHAIDAVYASPPAEEADGKSPRSSEFAVRGRLLDADGGERFGFVDVHRLSGGRIAELRTYTD